MRAFVFVFALLACAYAVHGAANNTLADCQAFAAKFSSTCNVTAGALSSIASHAGLSISCPTQGTCPFTVSGSNCVFAHKLCVTCSVSSGVTRIRVQTNGLPARCTLGASIVEQLVDFEVNYNPDVTFSQSTVTYNPATPAEVYTRLCALPGPGAAAQTVPATSNIVRNSAKASFAPLVGIAIDGMLFLMPPSADNSDPFYPPSGLTAPMIDTCLSHGTEYHYHSSSPCLYTIPTGSISICTSANCPSAINIMKSGIPHNRTVIGVALDGHPIFGPYDESGNVITGGYDVCNGQFYDSIGNYGYVTTTTMPYITSCFGPAAYPCAGPSCSTNPAPGFTRSSYLPAGNCTGTSAGFAVAPMNAVVALLAVIAAVCAFL